MAFHNCSDTKWNISAEDYLQSLEDEANKMMAPAVTLLVTLGLTGLVGNSLVLLVYSRNFRLNATKVLIMTIAGIDLVANTIAIPFEVRTMFNYWNFNNPAWCKAKVFFGSFTTVCGAIPLLATAFARYRKICVPFGWQISQRHAKLVSIAGIILGAFFSIPYTILAGRMSKQAPCYNYTVYECYTDDFYRETIWPRLNDSLFVLLYCATVIPLVVLYTFIGVRAKRGYLRQEKCNGVKHFGSPKKTGCNEHREEILPPAVLKPLSRLAKKHTLVELAAHIKVPPVICTDDDCKNCCVCDSDAPSGVATSSSDLKNESTDENYGGSDGEIFATKNTEVKKFLTIIQRANSPFSLESTNFAVIQSEIDVEEKKGEDVRGVVGDEIEKIDNFSGIGKSQGHIFSNMAHEGQDCSNTAPQSQNSSNMVTTSDQNDEGNSTNKNSNNQAISAVEQTPVKRVNLDKTNTGRRFVSRTTAMLIIITTIFCVGYFPYLILALYKNVFSENYASLSMAGLSIYHFFLKLYFLNCAANPIIYGLCDRKFRRECLKLLKCKKHRKV